MKALIADLESESRPCFEELDVINSTLQHSRRGRNWKNFLTYFAPAGAEALNLTSHEFLAQRACMCDRRPMKANGCDLACSGETSDASFQSYLSAHAGPVLSLLNLFELRTT
jgi:hypothetical protein